MQSNEAALLSTELCQRIAAIHPAAVRSDEALVIGIAAHVGSSDVIELVCPRALAAKVVANMTSLSIGGEAFARLAAVVADRGVDQHAVASDVFAERRKRVENALLCTVTETNGRKAWARPSVQACAVLAFQSATPPFDVLAVLFGTVVRSDLRRLEDLHFQENESPADAVLCARLIEAFGASALGIR